MKILSTMILFAIMATSASVPVYSKGVTPAKIQQADTKIAQVDNSHPYKGYVAKEEFHLDGIALHDDDVPLSTIAQDDITADKYIAHNKNLVKNEILDNQ